jgi:cyclopropane-fatty-acyl-phospholipid synthase
MRLFKLEHSPLAYGADLALYGLASIALALTLALASPSALRPELLLWAVAGITSWSLIEYLLHRFVLHGLAPFDGWHAQHHQRPTALITSPTAFSASLMLLLVTWPAWALLGRWPACALSFGVLTGYFLYALTHHATHHAHGSSAWLLQRKRWHALHHSARGAKLDAPGYYGVTSGLWDWVFGTAKAPRR